VSASAPEPRRAHAPAGSTPPANIPEEGLLALVGEAARLDQAGICRWRGKFGCQCRVVLAGIRRASSDVDEGRDIGSIPASLMTVPAQEWPTSTVGPVLQRQDAARAATSSATRSAVLDRSRFRRIR